MVMSSRNQKRMLTVLSSNRMVVIKVNSQSRTMSRNKINKTVLINNLPTMPPTPMMLRARPGNRMAKHPKMPTLSK